MEVETKHSPACCCCCGEISVESFIGAGRILRYCFEDLEVAVGLSPLEMAAQMVAAIVVASAGSTWFGETPEILPLCESETKPVLGLLFTELELLGNGVELSDIM